MKAKDLMIGDWILGLVEDNEQVGKVIAKHPARVTEINQNGDFSAECPCAFDELFDGDGHKIDDFVWYDTEPIPLTTEILEKNGWKKAFLSEGYGRRGMRLDGIPYTTGLPKGVDNALNFAEWSIDEKFEFHLLVIYMWKGSIRLWVNYVHELQHALRLCGIDKTIEII